MPKNIKMMPILYSMLSKSCRPFLKMSKIPENPNSTPINPRKVNFCKLKNMLKIKTRSGEVELIKEAKLLVNCFSATVVIPFATISMSEARMIWFLKFFQPIHFRFLENKRMINKIMPAKN